MNVLVVNGSPRGAKGNTAVLTDAFLEGAREAGATTKTIYLNDKRIEHCNGCFDCWLKTPGECVHNDAMGAILDEIVQHDVLVMATPLYVYTVSGLMKDFMDRLLPLVHPYIEEQNGRSGHPARYARPGERRFVLISNCGFPETSHFDGLRATIDCWMGASHRSLAGMICCAAGPLLTVPPMRESIQWYLDATRQAGREVVENGAIAEATDIVLRRSLAPDAAAYMATVNGIFESMGVPRPAATASA